MTTASNLITLALKTAGVLGVGQSALQTDLDDCVIVLDDMLTDWQLDRNVRGIPGFIYGFPDLSTDVPLPFGYENAMRWGLAVRLLPIYGKPEDEQLTKLAVASLAKIQATNRQYQPAPVAATTDTTGYGLVFLALRAAGRITDVQGAAIGSQDVSDGLMLLSEMLSEWQQDRTVTGTPGLLPVIADPTAAITLLPGVSSAILWNLAVRIRSAFGMDDNKRQIEQAERSLALIQANNKQAQPTLLPGVPATVLGLIYFALRMAGRVNDKQGVLQGSQDINDAFSLLVAMLAQWSRERWLVFDLSDVSVTSTGAASYSIGAGGDFSVARPDRIESAFVRLNGGTGQSVDYGLDILESREDYNDISYKGMSSFPSTLFYDSSYPLGTIYVWPIPQAGRFDIHLSVKATLPVYSNINALIGLPPEYNEALWSNLACRIMAWNGGQPTAYLMTLAAKSLRVIRGANAQVPRLSMPNGIPGRWFGGGAPYALGGFAYPVPAISPNSVAGAGIGSFAIGVSEIGGAISVAPPVSSSLYLTGPDGHSLVGPDGDPLTLG